MSKQTKQTFATLDDLAAHLRSALQPPANPAAKQTRFILIYAHNGTGKTRLSMAFKNAGKAGDRRDTLYFNAFTEDLFTWDNDLDGDSERVLRMNPASRFFAGLQELAMETRIRPLLHHYADFDFRIDYEKWTISFSRTIGADTFDSIKISRGEENIFIWCFFMAIMQLAIDGEEAYQWVKYIYIDDPISSLDDNNATAVATDVARLLRKPENKLKTVISSHHTLFFNVIGNELDKAPRYQMSRSQAPEGYTLSSINKLPTFQHLDLLVKLYRVAQGNDIQNNHFNQLRTVMESTASFFGFENFSSCVRKDPDDIEGVIHSRLINLMSHGGYSLFAPRELVDDNKAYFREILKDFLERYPFNPDLFLTDTKESKTP